ncbi:hypothetical protein OXX69_003481 [Metschnikowia pulcherrima]
MSRAISLSEFHQQLLRCFQNNIPNRLTLALSGGVDSMCLAYLLSQYKKKIHPQISISAITIDHGYREGSAREARKVGEIARSWGLDHSVETLQYTQDVCSISNFEEVARKLRYQVLRQKCLGSGSQAILVAHNKDDQLETFLQRLQMNSTMFGLRGLREMSPLPILASPIDSELIHVYRPLLAFEKATIRQTSVENDVEWFEDVSNQDISLTKRNLLRYMISEYVPKLINSRPEIECISRQSLMETTEEVAKLVQSYETEKQNLDRCVRSNDFQFDELMASVKFSIPLQELRDTRHPVLARWLYEVIYPLSSAKHFHWSFAKLERQAMARVWGWLDKPEGTLIMTYLNVSFNLNLQGSNVEFHLFRQSPQRDIIRHYKTHVGPKDSSWKLFDRIWWIRISNHDADVEIRYYRSSMRRELLNAFPHISSNEKYSRLNFEAFPVIIDEKTSQVLAAPTLGLINDGIYVECKLKRLS